MYVRYNINEVSGVLRLPTSPAVKIWVIHYKKMISSIGESNISTTRKLEKLNPNVYSRSSSQSVDSTAEILSGFYLGKRRRE